MSQPSLGPCARLTCETCKRRKVKCDKLRPCTACRRAKIHCVAVERARLPRGRSAKQKNTIQQGTVLCHQTSSLSNRVEMLEGLVRSLLDSRTETSLDTQLGDLNQIFFPSVRVRCRFSYFLSAH